MPHSVYYSSMANVTGCLLQLLCKCDTLSVAATFQISPSVWCSIIANSTLSVAAPLQMSHFIWCSSMANATLFMLQFPLQIPHSVCTSAIANSHSACCSSIANVTLSLLQLHFKCHTQAVAAPVQKLSLDICSSLAKFHLVWHRSIANSHYVCWSLIPNVAPCLLHFHCKLSRFILCSSI